MEAVLRCENYVQVDVLTVVDFTMLYVVCSHFTDGVTHRLLLSTRFSLLVINLLTIREKAREKRHYLLPLIQIVNKLITNDETQDDNNNRRVTT